MKYLVQILARGTWRTRSEHENVKHPSLAHDDAIVAAREAEAVYGANNVKIVVDRDGQKLLLDFAIAAGNHLD